MNKQELIDLVLGSFEAEKNLDAQAGLRLIHDDFKVTEMNLDHEGRPFHSESGQPVRESIGEVFQIKGRDYEFKNIVLDEKKQTVMIEFVESYPDPKSSKTFRTPLVAVCEVKDGKIYRTRHYCDPRLSYQYLDQEAIDEALS